MAYEAIEPMGNVEPTFMAANICAIVVNSIASIFRGKNSKVKTISPSEFIPNWAAYVDSDKSGVERPKSAETIDEMKALFQQIAAANPKKRKPNLKAPKRSGAKK